MYVCICKAVSDRQIRQAVQDGARSAADLRAHLQVCTGCGCCAEAVEACLRHALSECASEPEPWPQPGMASAPAS